MGTEAKKYLSDHKIPQLFEGLMTGLIYNKPDDPIEFIETSISKIKNDPSLALKWDSFVDPKHLPSLRPAAYPLSTTNINNKNLVKNESAGTVKKSEITNARVPPLASSHSNKISPSLKSRHSQNSIKDLDSPKTSRERCTSVMKAAESAQIPNVPIILFMGGPGGGKTKHAAKIRESMEEKGLIHICMPDLIKMAINRYSEKYTEWKNAGDKYSRGELIPNYLALQLIKAEMGRYQNAKAFFLEGFPREAQQVEDFEREVAPVNMALILDYDEGTLRNHMEKRGLSQEIINCKINEFKKKTLPSAKYFDDQGLLHLIPGENSNEEIFEKLSTLVNEAIEIGVPIQSIKSPVRTPTPKVESRSVSAKSKKSEDTLTKENQKAPQTGRSITKQSSRAESVKSVTSRKSNNSINIHGNQKNNSNEVVENDTKNVNDKENDTPLVSESVDKTENSIENKIVTLNATDIVNQTEEPQNEENTQDETLIKENIQDETLIKKNIQDENLIKENIQDEHLIKESTSDTRPSTISQRPPTSTLKTVTAVIEKEERKDTGEKKEAPILVAKDGITLNVPVILIIGPPGSNKTELSKKISQKYEGFTYLSMGELLRNMVEENKNDELWERIGKKMDVGEMIPMKICRELLFSAINEHSSTSWGFVIEGYPRSLPQLSDYETHGIRLDLAILIDCTEQFCIETLSKRFNKNDNTTNKRLDDDPEIVKARLEHFKQNNLPMLKALDDTGKLRVVRIEYKIDGDVETEKIFDNITDIIDGAIFVEENNAGKGLSSGNSNNTFDG
uniref:Adenylate kinase n=1 Tax=Strongyloides papillosus TaxID=174720 RepID=A0A0N5CDC8_STREA